MLWKHQRNWSLIIETIIEQKDKRKREECENP